MCICVSFCIPKAFQASPTCIRSRSVRHFALNSVPAVGSDQDVRHSTDRYRVAAMVAKTAVISVFLQTSKLKRPFLILAGGDHYGEVLRDLEVLGEHVGLLNGRLRHMSFCRQEMTRHLGRVENSDQGKNELILTQFTCSYHLAL